MNETDRKGEFWVTDHMPICPLAFRTGPFSTPLGIDTQEFLQNLWKYKRTYLKFVLNSMKMAIIMTMQ